MKEYTYEKLKFARLSGKSGLVSVVLTILLAIVFGIVFPVYVKNLITFGLIYILVICLGFYVFSWWPNITSTEDGVLIEFLSGKIRIPWGDILGIRQLYGMPGKAWLVSVKKITPLHYLLGLQFGLKPVPGFLIWEGISNRAELLSEIRKQT